MYTASGSTLQAEYFLARSRAPCGVGEPPTVSVPSQLSSCIYTRLSTAQHNSQGHRTKHWMPSWRMSGALHDIPYPLRTRVTPIRIHSARGLHLQPSRPVAINSFVLVSCVLSSILVLPWPSRVLQEVYNEGETLGAKTPKASIRCPWFPSYYHVPIVSHCPRSCGHRYLR